MAYSVSWRRDISGRPVGMLSMMVWTVLNCPKFVTGLEIKCVFWYRSQKMWLFMCLSRYLCKVYVHCRTCYIVYCRSGLLILTQALTATLHILWWNRLIRAVTDLTSTQRRESFALPTCLTVKLRSASLTTVWRWRRRIGEVRHWLDSALSGHVSTENDRSNNTWHQFLLC